MKTLFSSGFSLIEMAIVLIIIGLLFGSLLTPLSAQRDRQQIKRTLKTLEEVKEALLGFAILHNRLPCSDRDEDGLEDSPCDTNTTKIEGNLPWRDLGIGRYDGWGRHFRYRVDKEYSSSSISSSLKTDEDKKLKVRNKLGDINLTTFEKYEQSDGTIKNYSRVVAIIFSYGKNSKADNGNQFTAANDATYVQDVYVEDKKDPTKTFDDRLTWLSKHTLTNRLNEAKQLLP